MKNTTKKDMIQNIMELDGTFTKKELNKMDWTALYCLRKSLMAKAEIERLLKMLPMEA